MQVLPPQLLRASSYLNAAEGILELAQCVYTRTLSTARLFRRKRDDRLLAGMEGWTAHGNAVGRSRMTLTVTVCYPMRVLCSTAFSEHVADEQTQQLCFRHWRPPGSPSHSLCLREEMMECYRTLKCSRKWNGESDEAE